MSEELHWNSSFSVVRRLIAAHPGVDLRVVTLKMLCNWVIALPDFADDPQLVNDELLQAICQEWYEERLQSDLHANRPPDTG